MADAKARTAMNNGQLRTTQMARERDVWIRKLLGRTRESWCAGERARLVERQLEGKTCSGGCVCGTVEVETLRLAANGCPWHNNKGKLCLPD
jgi:hypothetical protein